MAETVGYYPYEIRRGAHRDGLTLAEYTAREIRAAITRGNPLLNAEDPFVVLGIDSFDGHIYPCASTQTAEEALAKVSELEGEEDRYSFDSEDEGGWSSDGPVNTFHAYTSEGAPVLPPPQTIEKQ